MNIKLRNSRPQRATKQVLTSSQVVLATLTSAGKEGPLGKLPENHFSVCVIDEASQALEVLFVVLFLVSDPSNSVPAKSTNFNTSGPPVDLSISYLLQCLEI